MMVGACSGNDRGLDGGVVHAEITTPGWVKRNDLGLGLPGRVGDGSGQNLITSTPTAQAALESETELVAVEEDGDDEDMSDLAFLRRHEVLAAEERNRWAGIGGGRVLEGVAGVQSGEVVRKRSRSTGTARKAVPLFPTPLECWKLVEEARAKREKEAGSIRMTEKVVKKRRRALGAVELPVQAFANVEAVLQRERAKVKKVLRKLKRESDRLGNSRQRSATMRVLKSCVSTLEATDHTFRATSADFMSMMKTLAGRANTTLTVPISFTSVHKDLIGVRRAAEAARMKETNMSLGAFIRLALDQRKYPELHSNFYLRDDYRLEGRSVVDRDARSDGLGSSTADTEVLGIMDSLEVLNTNGGAANRVLETQNTTYSDDIKASPRFGDVPASDPSTPKDVNMGSPLPDRSVESSRIDSGSLTPSIHQPLTNLRVSPSPQLAASHRGVELNVIADHHEQGGDVVQKNRGMHAIEPLNGNKAPPWALDQRPREYKVEARVGESEVIDLTQKSNEAAQEMEVIYAGEPRRTPSSKNLGSSPPA